MSHAATNWAIRQRGLKPATKIVLWHLADCHNGHTGQCNPRQQVLADMCEMSRSTLNLHLEKLEKAGLIERHTDTDPTTKRQRPTHYTLSMDTPKMESEMPEFEDEKAASDNRTRTQDVVVPCPKTGRGTEPEDDADPCPKTGQTRVRKSDTIENPGIRTLEDKCGDLADATNKIFDMLWSMHPRPKSQSGTERALNDALEAGADPDYILASAKRYANEQSGNSTRYMAGSDAWLRDERWKDYPPPEPQAGADLQTVIANMLASPIPAVRQAGEQLKAKQAVEAL